jgi:hypothetical protein
MLWFCSNIGQGACRTFSVDDRYPAWPLWRYNKWPLEVCHDGRLPVPSSPVAAAPVAPQYWSRAPLFSCDAHHSRNLKQVLTLTYGERRNHTAQESSYNRLEGAMSDNIFLYVSAAITLMVVIVSLLVPLPGSVRQRTRER